MKVRRCCIRFLSLFITMYFSTKGLRTLNKFIIWNYINDYVLSLTGFLIHTHTTLYFNNTLTSRLTIMVSSFYSTNYIRSSSRPFCCARCN